MGTASSRAKKFHAKVQLKSNQRMRILYPEDYREFYLAARKELMSMGNIGSLKNKAHYAKAAELAYKNLTHKYPVIWKAVYTEMTERLRNAE